MSGFDDLNCRPGASRPRKAKNMIDTIYMVRKLFNHTWSLRKEFAKYFIIGFTSFVLDLGSLYVFKEFLHFKPYVAVTINQLFILNYVFFMNKHWAFRAGGVTHRQMIKFAVLAGFNYVFSVAWMWFFTEFIKIRFIHPEYGYLFIRTANVVLAVAWNFFLYKYWIYREDVSAGAIQKT